MRLDRPIGTWLLYWPCAWSVALAGVGGRWDLFLWLALGAFAMRSAGCVYNDIVDRDLDRQVDRTRLRPLASGRVSLRSAWTLTILLCLIGVIVLIQLKWVAASIAAASLAPVAAYPFMKRITWWPRRGWVSFSRGAPWSAGRQSRASSIVRRCCCGSGASPGWWDTTRSMRSRTRKTMLWSASNPPRGGSAATLPSGSACSILSLCCCGQRRSGACGPTGCRC